MKIYRFIFLVIMVISCGVNKVKNVTQNKLKIIKIDVIKDHYVFQTKDNLDNEIIVLAEKDKVKDCSSFKKYIIADSIHKVSSIKSGDKKDLVGFNLSTIDGVKIRNNGELVKIINACSSFSD